MNETKVSFPELSLSELVDRLLAAVNPIILIHTRSDGDTVGSAAALYELLTALGKNCMVLADEKIPDRLSFLCKPGVFFSLVDGKTLPSEIATDIPHTVISVDVASPQQLGHLEPFCVGPLKPSFMIDHHESGTPFAPRYLEGDSAAAGELIYEIAMKMVEDGILKEIPPFAITAIYAAVSSDTGSFMHGNTTARSHRIAANLFDLGVDAEEINRLLFNSKSPETIAAEGYILSHINHSEDGTIAWAIISNKTRRELGVLDEHFETAIDFVRSLKGVEVAVTVKEVPEGGKFKVSLRSFHTNVAEVASCFGGGGHLHAAGCSVVAENGEEAAKAVVATIREHMGNQ